MELSQVACANALASGANTHTHTQTHAAYSPLSLSLSHLEAVYDRVIEPIFPVHAIQ